MHGNSKVLNLITNLHLYITSSIFLGICSTVIRFWWKWCYIIVKTFARERNKFLLISVEVLKYYSNFKMVIKTMKFAASCFGAKFANCAFLL